MTKAEANKGEARGFAKWARLYWHGLKHDSIVRFLVAFLIGNIVFFSILHSSPMSVPLFSDLRISEGTLAFVQPKRGGYLTSLEERGKEKNLFSCIGGDKVTRDCVPSRYLDQYTGKFARIWWFEIRESGESLGHRAVVQMEVDGKLVRAYDEMKQHYESRNPIAVSSGILIVFSLLGILIIVPLRHEKLTQQRSGK